MVSSLKGIVRCSDCRVHTINYKTDSSGVAFGLVLINVKLVEYGLQTMDAYFSFDLTNMEQTTE